MELRKWPPKGFLEKVSVVEMQPNLWLKAKQQGA